MTPTEILGAELQSLLRVGNASTAAQLLEIWKTIAPLQKDRARSAMEAAYWRTGDGPRFRPSRTPHVVVVTVIALAFHTEELDGVGDALNIFLFPDLYPSVGLEVAILTRKWEAILGGGHLDFLHIHESSDGKEKGS